MPLLAAFANSSVMLIFVMVSETLVKKFESFHISQMADSLANLLNNYYSKPFILCVKLLNHPLQSKFLKRFCLKLLKFGTMRRFNHSTSEVMIRKSHMVNV